MKGYIHRVVSSTYNMDRREGRRTICTTLGAGILGSLTGCLGMGELTGDEQGPKPPGASSGDTPDEYVPLGERRATFETVDDWTTHGDVEITVDESAPGREGKPTAKVNGSPGTIEMSVDPDIDLSTRDVVVVARIDQPQETNLRLRFEDAAGESFSLVSEYYRALHPTGWVTFSPSIVNASANLSSITNVLISIDGMDGGDPPLYWLDEIRFPQRTSDIAQFAFTYDDNTRDIYETFFPIMDEFGFPGAAAIHTSLIDEPDRMSLAEMDELSEAGWAMENHTHTLATLNGQSEEEQRSEIGTANDILQDHGFDPSSVMYPGGQCDNTTMEVMADVDMMGFLAFTSIVKGIAPSVAYEQSPRFINRSRPSTATEGKEMIDTAIQYGGTYPAYWHTIGEGGEIPEADFREICKYLNDRRERGEIEVVLPSELGR